MGLIKAALGAAGGVLADQWKDYFYCEAIPVDVLAVKGQKRASGRSSNTKGGDNIISDGSVIAVADGQCMLIVEQGKVVDVCAEPGEYTYDAATEPSIFTGGLNGESIMAVLSNVGKRFTFGGEAPMDQRIYYFNTKELIGNKYGTPSPVPFRVVDERAGIDIDISIRCFGEYSYKVVNPLLFYTNVCGNVSGEYNRSEIDGQLKSELLTALQPAFARISAMGVRYSALPGHTQELAAALKEELSAQWRDFRGIEIQRVGVSSAPCRLRPATRTPVPPWPLWEWGWRRTPAASTPKACSSWASSNRPSRRCSSPPPFLRHPRDGPAPAARAAIRASSVRAAERRNPNRNLPADGNAPAARRRPESSARSAENPSPPTATAGPAPAAR